jgi:hypothetical protein
MRRGLQTGPPGLLRTVSKVREHLKNGALPLGMIMSLGCRQDTTEPVDRVYAMLGILSDDICRRRIVDSSAKTRRGLTSVRTFSCSRLFSADMAPYIYFLCRQQHLPPSYFLGIPTSTAWLSDMIYTWSALGPDWYQKVMYSIPRH